MRIGVLLIPAVVLSALVAAGCGGRSAPSAAKWADSVCTEVNDWTDQIKSEVGKAQAELQSPSSATKANIQAGIQRSVDDTKQLVANLKALDAPGGAAGRRAKDLVDSLAADVQQTVTEIDRRVKAISPSASLGEAAAALAPIAGDISATLASAKNTLASIEALGSDLKDAFQKEDSCRNLAQ
ncbi:MAG TPA: hypothetical protein VF025_13640 [Gaiellaceae bacterium]